jgi:hypothetical protein
MACLTDGCVLAANLPRQPAQPGSLASLAVQPLVAYMSRFQAFSALSHLKGTLKLICLADATG